MAEDLGTDVQVQADVAPVQEEKPQEKMLTQSQVNDIVGRAKAQAAEKARREAIEESSRSTSMGGMAQLTPDQIQKMVEENTQKHLSKLQEEHTKTVQEQRAKEFVDGFLGKLESAKERNPEAHKKLMKIGLDKISHIVQLANNMDNTADIMHDLAENPTKIAHLHMLYSLSPDNPELAVEEMGKLSNSIKTNQAAVQQKSGNEPLRRITPSNSGLDSGSMSVRDLRNQSWMKA